jgi:hypothetical protein
MKFLATSTGILLALSAPAHAAYVIEVQQVGNNVVATGGGSINVSALSLFGAGGPNPSFVQPAGGFFLVGQTAAGNYFSGFTGPGSFGLSPAYTPASTSTGLMVGIAASENLLVLPGDYISGSLLSPSSGVFTNATFSTLGLQQGVYTWTWGADAAADSFTIRIGQSAVPEPATWATMLLGFVLIGGALRARRRQTTIRATYA